MPGYAGGTRMAEEFLYNSAMSLINESLSDTIRGLLYDVHNELGRYNSERQFCDAIEQKFIERGISYIREYSPPVRFPGEKLGRNRVDFIIDDTILLEVKVVPSFTRDTYHQCQRYLTAGNKKLLLLVNFFYPKAHIVRVLNSSL